MVVARPPDFGHLIRPLENIYDTPNRNVLLVITQEDSVSTNNKKQIKTVLYALLVDNCYNIITLITFVSHSSVVREAVTAVVAQSMHISNNLYFAVDTSV